MIDFKLVIEKLLDLLDQIKAQLFYIKELIKFNLINKNKNFIFTGF